MTGSHVGEESGVARRESPGDHGWSSQGSQSKTKMAGNATWLESGWEVGQDSIIELEELRICT